MNSTHSGPAATNEPQAAQVKPDLLVLDEIQRINFEGKIDRSGGPDACWLWTAGRTTKNYGAFRIGRYMTTSNRVAYRLYNGPIPDALPFICHTCDNPPCCNPKHLYAGTPKNNAEDREERGRGNQVSGDRHISKTNPEVVPRGSKHGRAKLTEEIVISMRLEYADGCITLKQLAAQYGVKFQVIWLALKGKTWKHVKRPEPPSGESAG